MTRLRLLALATVSLAMVASGPARAQNTVVCDQNPADFPSVSIPNESTKRFVVQPNFWNAGSAGGRLCVTVNPANGDFTITTAPGSTSTSGAPAGYPDIFMGCHWGNCTNNSGMPIQVSNIGTAAVTWSITPKTTGSWNAALDIWFHSGPTARGQPDGAEIMVWLNHLGPPQPFGGRLASSVAIGGTTWDVWQGVLTGEGVDWNVVSYVRVPPATALGSAGAPFDLRPIFADAQARGFLSPSWWLIAIEAGFEPWSDALNLASSGFSATVASGGGGGPGNQALALTKSGTGAGTVVSSPAGINCGAGCSGQSASFANGTNVSLTATAAAGATFAGWGGACSGTGSCSVAMTQSRAVTATFNGAQSGNVAVAPVIIQNSPWFHEQAVRVSNSVDLTALSVEIVVQRTPGVTHSGQYNTAGGIQQSNTGNSNPSSITYAFTLASGQRLGPGTNWNFVAQTGGTGVPHPMAGDTWRVTYTAAGGSPVTQSGTF